MADETNLTEPSASNPPASNSSLDTHAYASQQIPIRLTVSDGTTTSTRYVYKAVLCARAPIFIELTSDGDCVDFPNWRVETLESFIDWINGGRVLVRGLSGGVEIDVDEALRYDNCSASDDDAKVKSEDQVKDQALSTRPIPANAPWYASFRCDAIAHVLGRVLDVYSFALVGRIPTLASDCVLVWQRILCAPRNTMVYAPLIRAAEHVNLQILPSAFLAKIFRLVVRRANNGLNTEHGIPDPNDNWCRYHGHANEAEANTCRYARPDDWDVRGTVARQHAQQQRNINSEATLFQGEASDGPEEAVKPLPVANPNHVFTPAATPAQTEPPHED
ncbi:hypothetical protein BKA67DRAFT_660455 [Truncatella angustata]|uniref:Uncharacterized protein n=1 Tax=Truncatella angustata TaxID=152316 RepID=A0A9P8UGG2_9PEZI|nr:uncharacterized protein BKA67DRAFT_660455 [Truncatella angustata]KAH6651664.1 hypothetical protein BKA67DRAFT_660455 [Truncatella angustata]